MKTTTAAAQVVSFPAPAQPKRRPSTRKPRHRASKRQPGVVEQVRVAFRRDNALSTAFGFAFGGSVPIGIYFVAHREIEATPHGYAMLALAIGGLLFSAKTVWQWGRAAFGDPWKATGFVALLEGVMVLSHQTALSVAYLVLLTLVNAIATGVTVSRS